MKSVLEVIIKEWLVAKEFDGLYNIGEGCGCGLDDLIPECVSIHKCVAAKKVPCDCEDGCKFHLAPDEDDNTNPCLN